MAPQEPLDELNRSIRLLRRATAASWLVPPFMVVVPIVYFMNALAMLGKTDRGSEVPMTVVLLATYLLPSLFAARCARAGARAKRLLGDAPPDTVRHFPCPADAPDAFRIFTTVSTVQAILFAAPIAAPLAVAVYAPDDLAGRRGDFRLHLLRLLHGRTGRHPAPGPGLRVLERNRQRHAAQTG